MPLSISQKRQMVEDGYIHLQGVVPPERVAAALRAINHNLGQEGMNKDQLDVLRSRSYCPELSDTSVITDLIDATPAFELAESALGPGKLDRNWGGQIALRFPALEGQQQPLSPHLDGTYSPHNGVVKGTIKHFTMLAAVFLTDIPGPNQGNFTVWPGTHRLFESYFRREGFEVLLKGLPPVTMPEPRQLVARAGDVVLTHYQVAHSVGPHYGPNIRYAVFFRLHHVDHETIGDRVMTDIWAEWAGLGEALEESIKVEG